MTPLQHWPLAARAAISGVLTDIDDTLTTDGAITADALAALSALRAAGLPVIAVTGRPVGWSEPFALRWPLNGIVAENGAVLLHAVPFNHQKGLWSPYLLDSSLSKSYQQDALTRSANAAHLQRVAARVLSEVPGALLARDSAGRETDIAIDHSEFTHLPPERIAQAVSIMRAEGLTVSVSSIHINGWLGLHNKLQGADWAVRQLLQTDLATQREKWVFIGDSTNDELMFEAFPNAIGVANVQRFAAQLTHQPRYITTGERGAGFAEMVSALLAARNQA